MINASKKKKKISILIESNFNRVIVVVKWKAGPVNFFIFKL